jgi:Tol biopolymer transport system component
VEGAGLFKIPVDGGKPFRLVTGQAFDPVWSPNGNLIVYSGALHGGTAPLLAVHPDGSSVDDFPTDIKTFAQGGGSSRFLSDGKGLVYLQGPIAIGTRGFWLLDLTTKKTRQLARLPNSANTSTFDITPDGKQIVFDRLRENSDIVLIDLPR